MSERRELKTRANVASILPVASLFSRYKPEKEQLVRKPMVVVDEVLTQLLEAWANFNPPFISDPNDFCMYYDVACKLLKGINYSARDIEKFSIALTQRNRFYEGMLTGVFLSALVNEGEGMEYRIYTENLEKSPWYMGLMNKKKITIFGSVGGECGNSMYGGEIEITGSAHYSIAHTTFGGKITVHGEFTGEVGINASHATLVLNGDPARIWCYHYSGEVYVNGVLIPVRSIPVPTHARKGMYSKKDQSFMKEDRLIYY